MNVECCVCYLLFSYGISSYASEKEEIIIE